MTAWFGDNWWWLIPVAMFIGLVGLTVRKHRVIAQTSGGNWWPHIDSAIKTLLGAFAFFLGYGAFATGWLLGIVPAAFMAMVLIAPNRTRVAVPNWSRYVGYFTLFVLFIWAFPLKADG